MPSLSPMDIILQELAVFAASHGLHHVGVGEMRDFAGRIYARLNDGLVSHVEAARLLGVSSDTMHSYRELGWIFAILKSPNKKSLRNHYLYRRMDVLELKTTRSGRHHRRS